MTQQPSTAPRDTIPATEIDRATATGAPLDPIELPYSKFKAFLRKLAQRIVPGLYRAIRSFVPQLGA